MHIVFVSSPTLPGPSGTWGRCLSGGFEIKTQLGVASSQALVISDELLKWAESQCPDLKNSNDFYRLIQSAGYGSTHRYPSYLRGRGRRLLVRG
jgi:hypothetical protein